MVTLIGLLKEHHNLPLTDYEIAQLAHRIERVDLASWAACRTSTRPRSAASTSSSSAADRVIVNPLRMSPDVVNELEHNMLLCYTGATRPSTA